MCVQWVGCYVWVALYAAGEDARLTRLYKLNSQSTYPVYHRNISSVKWDEQHAENQWQWTNNESVRCGEWAADRSLLIRIRTRPLATRQR